MPNEISKCKGRGSRQREKKERQGSTQVVEVSLSGAEVLHGKLVSEVRAIDVEGWMLLEKWFSISKRLRYKLGLGKLYTLHSHPRERQSIPQKPSKEQQRKENDSGKLNKHDSKCPYLYIAHHFLMFDQNLLVW